MPRWYKTPGITREPVSEEIHLPGVQMCLVWDHGSYLELKRLIVRRECQDRGIGSAVLRLLQSRGKKIVLYPLSDDGQQANLERFYRRAGFAPDFLDEETWVWNPTRI